MLFFEIIFLVSTDENKPCTFNGNFHNFLFHFVVKIDAVFRAPDIVRKIITTKVLLQVVQPVE